MLFYWAGCVSRVEVAKPELHLRPALSQIVRGETLESLSNTRPILFFQSFRVVNNKYVPDNRIKNYDLRYFNEQNQQIRSMLLLKGVTQRKIDCVNCYIEVRAVTEQSKSQWSRIYVPTNR
jgi:hypothetical protein